MLQFAAPVRLRQAAPMTMELFHVFFTMGLFNPVDAAPQLCHRCGKRSTIGMGKNHAPPRHGGR
jgi:hypothetical protein